MRWLQAEDCVVNMSEAVVLGLLTLMGPAALCNRLGVADSSLLKWRRGGKALPQENP